jgi:hypothetical protein
MIKISMSEALEADDHVATVQEEPIDVLEIIEDAAMGELQHASNAKYSATNSCDCCGKAFIPNSHVMGHIKSHEEDHDNSRLMFRTIASEIHYSLQDKSCPICDRIILRSSGFAVHMFAHRRLPNIQFSVCDKDFHKELHQQEHHRARHSSQTVDDPFPCHLS